MCISDSALYGQRFPVLRKQVRLGGPGDDVPARLVSDSEGRLYVSAKVQEKGNHISEHFGCSDIWLVCLTSEGIPVWEKSLGGVYCDEPGGLQYAEGKVWLTGSTASFLTHPETGEKYRNGDAFRVILKMDGSIEEYSTFGASEKEVATTGIFLPDGSFCWAGLTFSELNMSPGMAGCSDIWIQKIGIDSLENSGFMAGGPGNDWPVDMHLAQDGRILLSANTSRAAEPDSKSEEFPKPWIFSFDAGLKNRKSFLPDTKSNTRVLGSTLNQNGTITLVGTAYSESLNPQFWFLISDMNGNVLSEKIWGGSGAEYLSAVRQCKDGGWILTGWSSYYGLENNRIKGGDDLWVIRLNPDGETEWEKTYGGPGDERGVDVMEFIPGVYYILGQRQQEPDQENRDIWLLKIEEEFCDLPEVMPAWKFPGPEPRVGQYIQFVAGTEEKVNTYWEFGDGTISKELNPMKKYYRTGIFEVKVRFTGKEGCEKKFTLENKIEVK